MSQTIKTIALVTARGGSKSIPKKNIKELVGKPLLAYSIEAARGSKLLTRAVLNTDDEEIADVGRKYGMEIPFMRPRELAQDNSTHMEVIQHTLRWFRENEGKEYDYLMILQPTSPMRTAEDIDACIKIAEETGADSVMSMMELTDMSLKKMKKINEKGQILPYAKEEGKQSSRRQDLEKIYKRNCAVYLTKTACIMEGDLFGADSRAYIMPEERSVDVNKPVDFELAEFWMLKKLGKL